MVTLSPQPGTIHDFYGFPEELYGVRYPAPGAPDVARRVLDLLEAAGIEAEGDAARGLDHGAWVPLGLMYPEADVPVVQLSVQPGMDAAYHSAVGRALAPLGREGVLILGSGGATHNLADVRWDDPFGASPADYATAFDAWLKSSVLEGRGREVEQYLTLAPQGRRNHPTPEHFLPLFAPMACGGNARLVHDAFTYGVLSMAAFVWED
jgi:4,5-DOPA dioxygenase extradiol